KNTTILCCISISTFLECPVRGGYQSLLFQKVRWHRSAWVYQMGHRAICPCQDRWDGSDACSFCLHWHSLTSIPRRTTVEPQEEHALRSTVTHFIVLLT